MTKKIVLLVLALVGMIGLARGCQENSSDTKTTSSPPTSPNLADRNADTPIDVEDARVLVGHWRKTAIVFEKPKDEHLVLDANGNAETWDVTASSRSRTTSGTWSVEGKNLTLRLEGNVISSPFTKPRSARNP